MQFNQVTKALEQAGSEQVRKTYARHGVTQPMFAVSFAEFKKLSKKIKMNPALA